MNVPSFINDFADDAVRDFLAGRRLVAAFLTTFLIDLTAFLAVLTVREAAERSEVDKEMEEGGLGAIVQQLEYVS